MGWVTAAGDDLILVELKWWETFSSLYLGQGRSGNKNRELTAQRKKHSGLQCSPEGSRWSLFQAPSSSCSPDVGSCSSRPLCAPWDGNWCQGQSLSLSQGSLASHSTLLDLPNQRNLQMTADAANFEGPSLLAWTLGKTSFVQSCVPPMQGACHSDSGRRFHPCGTQRGSWWSRITWFTVSSAQIQNGLLWEPGAMDSNERRCKKEKQMPCESINPNHLFIAFSWESKGVRLSCPQQSADSLNPIFLGLINGSISGFIWSSLNLGTELTHSARNIVFFFIFLKFFMIMVQKWSLGFPPQPLLTLSLSFEGVSLFVCLRALYSLHYWVLLKNGRLLCLKDYTIYVLL